MAQVATGLFLDDVVCAKLKDKVVFVVPPEIDIPRKLNLAIVRKIDDDKFEFYVEGENLPYDELVDKSLLISEEDAKTVFGNLPFKNVSCLIGKIVIDENLGKIGVVKDVAGTSAQKHLIVEHLGRGGEVLIPFVSDLIKDEYNNVIIMSLPSGLIEMNKD